MIADTHKANLSGLSFAAPERRLLMRLARSVWLLSLAMVVVGIVMLTASYMTNGVTLNLSAHLYRFPPIAFVFAFFDLLILKQHPGHTVGWLIVFIGFFLWAIGTGADFAALPVWFGAAFAHSGFVGMMTNLLMGVLSARTQDAKGVIPWGETAALWAIDGGILLFFALKIFADARWGAIIMGSGVLLGVFVMFMRLRASGAPSAVATSGD